MAVSPGSQSQSADLDCFTSWYLFPSAVDKPVMTLCDPMDTKLLHPWDFLGKSTGVGCLFLLQGIFPTQALNPHFLYCRWRSAFQADS